VAGTPHRVVIAGGGVAALEVALALRGLAGGTVASTLLTADRYFTYRPLSVGEPFGLGGAFRYEIADLANEGGFEVRPGAVTAVHPGERRVTAGKELVEYDTLVVAIGARALDAVDGAVTFAGPSSVGHLADSLGALAGPDPRTVAFVAPPGVVWTLPIYELALMTATWARDNEHPLEVHLVTAEPAPLAAMEGQAQATIADALSERGVELHVSTACRSFSGSQLHHDGGALAVDLAVSLPLISGPELAGLPHDEHGFIPVDERGRVPGVDGVYAVGDAADHAIKQGGLATQQADVAAHSIANDVSALHTSSDVSPPVLRAMVMTGDTPLWLTEPDDPGMPGPPESGISAPWWPAHKIAGRFLGPFLLTQQYLQKPPENQERVR
jgi:sulfide:quinone oxidoreductase